LKIDFVSSTILLSLFFNLNFFLMSFLDIVLGAFLGYAIYKGIKNGIFVEFASLLSLIVGIYAAIKFSYIVRSIIAKMVSWSPATVQIVSFVITLVLIVIAVNLLGSFFTKLFSLAHLGWLNKLGGAIFSVLKTAVLLGVVLSLLLKLNFHDVLISKETQESSYFFKPILKTSEILLPVLTEWFKDVKAFVVNAN
jgi:membrane protein required for colicin V production